MAQVREANHGEGEKGKEEEEKGSKGLILEMLLQGHPQLKTDLFIILGVWEDSGCVGVAGGPEMDAGGLTPRSPAALFGDTSCWPSCSKPFIPFVFVGKDTS